jgi:hypothetical protein
MSMMTSISQHTPSMIVMRLLGTANVDWITETIPLRGIPISVNGVMVATTTKPNMVFSILKEAKRTFVLHPHSGVTWSVTNQEIGIETDGGRIVRPLFRVKDGKILPRPEKDSWDEWMNANVEYVDSSESAGTRLTGIDVTVCQNAPMQAPTTNATAARCIQSTASTLP